MDAVMGAGYEEDKTNQAYFGGALADIVEEEMMKNKIRRKISFTASSHPPQWGL